MVLTERRKAMEEMGMSDMQFKSYLRELIHSIEQAKDSERSDEELEKLIERLKKSLED